MRTARAKGLPYRAVLWRHALRNAMIPVLTILGLLSRIVAMSFCEPRSCLRELSS
ncbi:hypothetical protein [Mesorhizobium sp. P17.1]|uniref:hypothetical protein n=1 Tax=Mesorhizobium sp. P17.1 TaxID=3033797 RepID=UPI0023DF9FEE|nr:hypothetical protein [Mesorhizobium sp. P17.1]MDF3179977.1 hypothetical protein [Mesorhizobium sp. P17.1]